MTAGRELITKTDNRHLHRFKCKLSCCKSCSYCTRAFPKDRFKSWVSRLLLQRTQIKICEKFFLCHSIVLCKTCNKCTKCCLKSTCRGETSKLLASLAGSGGRSDCSSNPERRLHPSISVPAQTDKVSHSKKQLCQSSQEQLPVRGIASAYRQKCSRTSSKPNISGIFQQTFLGLKTQQQVEAHFRSQQSKPVPQSTKIQNGDTGNYQDLPPTRGVGNLSRFQGHLLPNTHSGTVQGISKTGHISSKHCHSECPQLPWSSL